LASCTGGLDGLGGKPSFPLSRRVRRGTRIDEPPRSPACRGRSIPLPGGCAAVRLQGR
jgi:hypothetical protein